MLKKIQIETAIIHIANSFLSMGMDIATYDDTLIKEDDSQKTIVLKKILKDIAKKSILFKKDVDKNVSLATEIFSKLESTIRDEILHPKPRGRFNKQCRLNEDGDLEANAILLCVSLIREHRNLENRKIHLQYKLAQDVITELLDNKTKGYENARILSKRYVQELHKI